MTREILPVIFKIVHQGLILWIQKTIVISYSFRKRYRYIQSFILTKNQTYIFLDRQVVCLDKHDYLWLDQSHIKIYHDCDLITFFGTTFFPKIVKPRSTSKYSTNFFLSSRAYLSRVVEIWVWFFKEDIHEIKALLL